MSRGKAKKNKSLESLIGACITDSSYRTKSLVPDQISITFREDYDITSIDRLVLAKLRDDIALTNSPDSKSKLEKYIRDSEQYLAAYQIIGPSHQTIDIMDKSQKYLPSEYDVLRVFTIKKYLKIASRHIYIDFVCTGDKPVIDNTHCNQCGASLANMLPNPDGSVECPECPAMKYLRIERDKGSESDTGTGHEDLANFIKNIHRFQSKIIPKVDLEEVRISLDKHFEETGKPSSDEIRALPLDQDGKKPNTSVQIMLKAMADRQIKCYSDVYYICSFVWGWKPFDVSHIEDQMIEDYKKTQRAWYSMPSEMKQRESSLPMGYRMCQHLRLRGWLCPTSDFKIPKNVSHYDESWKYMCEHSGDATIVYRSIL